MKLIKNYLSNRKQCVKIGNITSEWEDIYKGVPQGSILGPVLFKYLEMIYFILYKKVPSMIMQMITLCHMKATIWIN